MLCKRIVVSKDIKHSITPVRRFDLLMRNTRRTVFLGSSSTIPRCPWALIDSQWTCEQLMNACDWESGRQWELIVRFDHKATDEFPYMYHCHILEHEDRDMMGQFTVA